MRNSSYWQGRADGFRDAVDHLLSVVKQKGGKLDNDPKNILVILFHDYSTMVRNAEEKQLRTEINETSQSIDRLTEKIPQPEVD